MVCFSANLPYVYDATGVACSIWRDCELFFPSIPHCSTRLQVINFTHIVEVHSMKLSRLFLLALLPVAFVLSTNSSNAQESVAPDGQFGIQAGTYGFGLQYAASPSLQIGLALGLATGDTPTEINFSPYVRWLFEGTVNPFVFAGATIKSEETVGGDAATSTALGAGFGLAYYINPNVGVFGQFSILSIGLDPSFTNFGLFNGHAGVEMFF